MAGGGSPRVQRTNKKDQGEEIRSRRKDTTQFLQTECVLLSSREEGSSLFLESASVERYTQDDSYKMVP